MWTTLLSLLGTLTLSLVAAHLGVELIRLILRCWAEGKVRRQEIERLRLEIRQLRVAPQGRQVSSDQESFGSRVPGEPDAQPADDVVEVPQRRKRVPFAKRLHQDPV